MSNLRIKSTRVVTPLGVFSAVIELKEGKFFALHPDTVFHDIDYQDKVIFPGVVDIHIHGWGRGSFAYKGELNSLRLMGEDLVKVGVTSYLPTTVLMPNDFLEYVVKNGGEFIEGYSPDKGAEPIGIHLEGPFISEEHLGLQRKDCLQMPSISVFKRFNQLANNHIKLMTLAPELEGSLPLIRYLTKNGIAVSAGHTNATFMQVAQAINAGLKHFTHAYSAMRGFHHRELGVVGALMYFQDTYAEVAKQTGLTIKPEAFDLLYRMKTDERLIMMSDCMGYADFQEGSVFYHYLRKQKFIIQGDKLMIISGNGHCEEHNRHDYEQLKELELSHLQSMANVFERLNNGWVSLSKLCCENPAKLVGSFDRKGSIEVGKDADFIVLDDSFELIDCYCHGYRQIISN
jgi:N-acetylglucosamine-6-phosphate deacetylase